MVSDLSSLDHKNLIKYYTSFLNMFNKSKFCVSNTAFEIVTDYIHGNLENILKQFGAFDSRRVGVIVN